VGEGRHEVDFASVSVGEAPGVEALEGERPHSLMAARTIALMVVSKDDMEGSVGSNAGREEEEGSRSVMT